jgi:hypothetical protein
MGLYYQCALQAYNSWIIELNSDRAFAQLLLRFLDTSFYLDMYVVSETNVAKEDENLTKTPSLSAQISLRAGI